jgi:hypothetical protein
MTEPDTVAFSWRSLDEASVPGTTPDRSGQRQHGKGHWRLAPVFPVSEAAASHAPGRTRWRMKKTRINADSHGCTERSGAEGAALSAAGHRRRQSSPAFIRVPRFICDSQCSLECAKQPPPFVRGIGARHDTGSLRVTGVWKKDSGAWHLFSDQSSACFPMSESQVSKPAAGARCP